MKSFCFLSVCSLFAFSPILAQADTHGAVHVRIPTCESDNDGFEECSPEFAIDLKPWYCYQQYDECDDGEHPVERLEEDTAWPGQREEFSDQLLR